MRFNSKLITALLALSPAAFAYIDQPCSAGSNGRGVCIKSNKCVMYSGQQGKIIRYSGSAPNWPCPNDPDDVICCVKEVTQLRDGKTKRSGRCLNVSECSGETVSTAECPGSNKVKLCINKSPLQTTCTVNGVTGTCMNPNNCSGTVYSGYCPGGADNKCCIKVNPQNKCPTAANHNTTKSGKSKISESLPLILESEGQCGNNSADSGNWFEGQLGYTCMGITPLTGWNNRKYFQYALSKCSGNKAMFVKCAYDLSKTSFQAGAEKVYETQFVDVAGCTNLPQPAYYVCLDTAVNHGPYWTQKRVKENPIGNKDGKTYGLALNNMSRNYYKEIAANNPSKQQFLNGWLNRATKRENYCNAYCK